jgi:hypothetical protein
VNQSSSLPRPRRRANELLQRVLRTGWYTDAELAQQLVMSPDALATFAADQAEMPLDRQLCLALFVIENVPPLARRGHQLRAQIAAAARFRAKETARHNTPPPSQRWS